jgi:uncharacterized protein YbjT (DUF2867 family)
MILVVGATGQLGTALVRKLSRSGRPVRAFVRPTARYQHLQGPGVELAFGDLRSAESVAAACREVTTVLATASAVVPRSGDTFAQIDDQGYRHLVDASSRNGVSRFVFVSVPVTPHDDQVPTFRHKRAVERLLQASGLGYTIVRADFFMDDWLALIGSSIPLRGAESHTLERPFWFSRVFMRMVGHLVERRGIALVPGRGTTRHAFIALDDVAEFMIRSIDAPNARNAIWEVGGPEILSWDEAVAVFARVLGRSIRAVHQPPGVFRAAMTALMPLSPPAANLMGLNYIGATIDTLYDARALARSLGIELSSLETFLRARIQP